MAYYDTFDDKEYSELADRFEFLKPAILTSKEERISEMVAASVLSNYSKRQYAKSPILDLANLYQNTAIAFYELGLVDVAQNAVYILKNVKIVKTSDVMFSSFSVQSDLVETCSETGAHISKRPNHILAPKNITKSSVPFMMHEVSHILKELNPSECHGVFTDIEVIPMLIEIITAYENDDRNVFKRRERLIVETASTFVKLKKDKDNNLINNDKLKGFMTLYRQCISYLNSFYYTMMLFEMYLNQPTFVLELVNSVLLGGITTNDVIRMYIDDSSYDDGFNYFKMGLY